MPAKKRRRLMPTGSKIRERCERLLAKGHPPKHVADMLTLDAALYGPEAGNGIEASRERNDLAARFRGVNKTGGATRAYREGWDRTFGR